MSSIIVYQHFGLGDHFMCHGIIREYAKMYEKVGVLALERNYPTVAFMFRDLKNVKVIKVNDIDAKRYVAEEATTIGDDVYDKSLVLGFGYMDRNSGILFEKQFYARANIDISKKWDSFFVDRDREKEEAILKQFAPKKDYIFLHEDTSRKYLIDRKLIDRKYTIFTPDPQISPNAFDLCTIIEHAKEIHVIDSSFMFLIDCLSYSNPDQRLFIHRYSRENEDWKLPILKKKWRIYSMENYHVGFLRYIRRRITEYKGRMINKLRPPIKKEVVIA